MNRLVTKTVGRGEQTPGQAHASARKKKRRAERLAADTQEATRLGITVPELHRRRHQESERFRRGKPIVYYGSAPTTDDPGRVRRAR